MSYVLGLTGPTGAGKSIFAQCAAQRGFKVIDCDISARKAVEKGTKGLAALVSVFGGGILKKSGELDRGKLARIAFSSREKTELLNKTLLPHICKIVKSEISGDFVLLDAPTLFESGMNGVCNATAAVIAPIELRKARIIERDGLSGDEADMRINAGKPDEFYYENANRVFINGNDIDSFKKSVNIYLDDIIGGNPDE
ncbi:MAG: dephospho-CoA kinase [Clostridia bacterium]|nr:dephospho-CoA kinase [Clostridia bacterium]